MSTETKNTPAEQFLKDKGLKDTLYDVKNPGQWIKGGLSTLLEEYSQAKEKELKATSVRLSIMAGRVETYSKRMDELSDQLTAKEAELEGTKEIARARGEAITELQKQLEESLLLYNNQTETIAKRDAELKYWKELAEALKIVINDIDSSLSNMEDYEALKNQKPNSEPED